MVKPPKSPVTDNSSIKNLVLGAVLIMGLTAGAYFPAASGSFIMDDTTYISENPDLRDPQGLKNIWANRKAHYQIELLPSSVFWLGFHLWGENPLGYHLNNILLHGVNAVLFMLILRQLAVP